MCCYKDAVETERKLHAQIVKSCANGEFHDLMANPATIAAAVSSPLQSSADIALFVYVSSQPWCGKQKGLPFLHKVFNATLAQLTTFKSR